MAQRATSLGPRPSLFVFLVFLFCSLFCFFGCLIQNQKPCFFPQKRAFLFIFSVSLSFSLCPFGPPSFSVSLSQSLFFLLFFLSSFLSLFLLSFGSLSLSLFFLSFFLFLLCFSFMKGTTSKYSIASFFGLPSFLFFKFPVFLFQVPFCYLSSFLILSYVFCSTSRFLVSKQRT